MSDLSAAQSATTADTDGDSRAHLGEQPDALGRRPIRARPQPGVLDLVPARPVALLMAFFPHLFAETSPTDRRCLPPDQRAGRPDAGSHPFGYTKAGCDMWSSLVYGTGKSVIVAILVTIGTVILGVAAGTAAGWFGGFTDTLISRITDIFFGLPFILGAIVFLAIFPDRNI